MEREGASWAQDLVSDLGHLAGTEEAIRWGFQANENPPQLHTHDRFGNRIDEVEFHPAWHQLMQVAIRHGLHALPWRMPRPGAHAARAAAFYIWSQVEGGHGCPVSMTYAVVPTLRKNPQLAEQWEPLITSLEYDPSLRVPSMKRGALFGMAMTERQGGSDVRANTTRAVPAGTEGEYRITGHKWFVSAPMCDAFLVLAQAPGGLSCFLLPRVLPDGTRNGFHIQRLKDKLGNRSNASSEVELDDALAMMVGEEGRGVRTIIDMVNHTRLDCVIGSASLMRQAVAQATHHTAHRSAFGKLLSEQPLMVNVLADIAVESEATTMLMMRLARAFDGDDQDAHFRRLATAVAKYWCCKRAIAVVAEALEYHGGNGYVEESILPRLYREAPLNSIWGGAAELHLGRIGQRQRARRAARNESRARDARSLHGRAREGERRPAAAGCDRRDAEARGLRPIGCGGASPSCGGADGDRAPVLIAVAARRPGSRGGLLRLAPRRRRPPVRHAAPKPSAARNHRPLPPHLVDRSLPT